MKIENVKAGEVFTGLKKDDRIHDVLIPVGVFDDSNSEDQKLKSLVPHKDKTYRFVARLLKPALVSMHYRHNILTVGPTGVGKTMLFKMIAATCNLPITRINGDGEMGRVEIVGYLGLPNPSDPNDDGYKMPALVRAIQRPGLVLVDEWDALRPEASLSLQPLLEDHSPGLMLVEREEFIPKHPDCIVCATANTRGLGDADGLYAGTQNQNFAQLNRFHNVMVVEPLPRDQVRAILRAFRYGENGDKSFDDDDIERFSDFYQAVINAKEDNSITTIVSVRSMIHLGVYYSEFGKAALEMAVANKMPSEKDRLVVLELGHRFDLAEDPANY